MNLFFFASLRENSSPSRVPFPPGKGVVWFCQIFPAFSGYEPNPIEEQKRKSRIGPDKIAAKKAKCAIKNDDGNKCELNYREDLFHTDYYLPASTKNKARFWRAVKKSIRGR